VLVEGENGMCVFVKFDLSLDRKDVEHDIDDFLGLYGYMI